VLEHHVVAIVKKVLNTGKVHEGIVAIPEGVVSNEAKDKVPRHKAHDFFKKIAVQVVISRLAARIVEGFNKEQIGRV